MKLLPSKEIQDNYLVSQREALLNQKFTKEFELSFAKERLEKTDKGKRKEIRAEITQLTTNLEGIDEYLHIINKHLSDELTELDDGKKRNFAQAKIDEVKKGNFRGLLAKELSEYRQKNSKDVEIQEEEEGQLEEYDEALKENDLIYGICSYYIKNNKFPNL